MTTINNTYINALLADATYAAVRDRNDGKASTTEEGIE